MAARQNTYRLELRMEEEKEDKEKQAKAGQNQKERKKIWLQDNTLAPTAERIMLDAIDKWHCPQRL